MSERYQALRRRWTEVHTEMVVEWLGNRDAHLPWPERTEGGEIFHDLRGVTLDVLRETALSHVDLSYAHIATGLIDCSARACLFRDFRAYYMEKDFENCDFAKADFVGSSLAYSAFLNCGFQGVQLRRAFLGGSVFKRCNLTGAFLRNAVFGPTTEEDGTVFEDCDLTGARFGGRGAEHSLHGIVFRRCRLDNVHWGEADQSEAIFED